MADNSAAPVVETTTLLGKHRQALSTPWNRRSVLIVIVAGVAVFLAGTLLLLGSSALNRHKTNTIAEGRSKGDTRDLSPLLLFPTNFVWGVATSAYQIEGGVHEGGRGATVWDTFTSMPGTIVDNSSGEIEDDHYHRWRDDIVFMERELGVKAYRFSIA